MAHFAKIDDSNIVLQVVRLNDSDMLNGENVETESVGQQYLQTHNNWPANKWIQTSYNTIKKTHTSGDNSKAFIGNYAAIGYTWDSGNEIFWPPQPYGSWTKNNSAAKWQSPLGDAPALSSEQQSQNNANTHAWSYHWDESEYQADNNNGWILTNSKA